MPLTRQCQSPGANMKSGPRKSNACHGEEGCDRRIERHEGHPARRDILGERGEMTAETARTNGMKWACTISR